VVVLSFLGVVERQRGYGGTQYIHRHNVFGSRPQQTDDGGVELALLGEVVTDFLEFISGRQAAIPQEITGSSKVEWSASSWTSMPR